MKKESIQVLNQFKPVLNLLKDDFSLSLQKDDRNHEERKHPGIKPI
jgi:hypothetical protein